MQRFSKKNMLAMADIDTHKVGSFYFPYPEVCRQVGYSCGVYGCTGRLFKGMTSNCLYFVDPYDDAGANWQLVDTFGAREKSIIERLSFVEVDSQTIEALHRKTVTFVAVDGARFSVTSTDHGHTWRVCY